MRPIPMSLILISARRMDLKKYSICWMNLWKICWIGSSANTHSMDDYSFNIEAILSQVVGKDTRLGHYRVVASGNNKGLYLESDRGVFFLKTNVQRHADIFEKETSGLDLLRRNTFLTIPRTCGQGRIDGLNYLLMEWIPSGRRKGDYWEVLARGLARLHRTKHVEFGLYEDNYIAVLSQTNSGYATWPEFFIEN